MHDIRAIKNDPASFDEAMKRRGADYSSASLIALDEERVATVAAMNEAQAEQKAVSKRIGAAKAAGDEETAASVMREVGLLKDRVKQLEEQERQFEHKLFDAMLPIPNILSGDVPEGADEEANEEVMRWGDPRSTDGARDHVDLGEGLGMMDFAAAAKLSGSRFVVLKADLAKLERVIATFMLHLHTEEFGYEEVMPPVLVLTDPLIGTGQLPKFEEDQFKTTGDHYLTPTAEVTLTNLVRGDILSEDALPKRYTAWTQCFRAEAGSAGRDTRGLIRMHQFSKVELVSVTAPEKSQDEHERMTNCAEEVLRRLNLPYRKMVLCSGDVGFSAVKTYDLEVWLPGQGQYREISSCSNCEAFQARRMQARYRREGQKKPEYVHTLNGSGLAVGRTMVAILENYQQKDGSIVVPPALRSLMGQDVIEPR